MAEDGLEGIIKDYEKLVGLIESSPRLEKWEREGMLALSARIAMYDPLTTLLSKAHVESRLRQEISRAQRHYTPLSIIMLDIDNFHLYNITYGQLQGDVALANLGPVINRDSGRKEDIVGRYGGEEFLVVLPQTDLKGAERAASKICRTVRDMKISKYVGIEERRGELYDRQRGYQEISVSAGIAFLNQAISTPELLVNTANESMLRAKELQKRNFFSSF